MKKKEHQPLYKKIKAELGREIQHKQYPPNTPFLTENEAIERFGVSRVTVRQAFDLLEQEGYIYRVQGKGSFISALETQPVKTVAFLATCIMSNGVESVLLRSVEDYLDRQNISLIICNNSNRFDKTQRYLERLVRSGVDGVIYVSVLAEDYERNAPLIQFLSNHDIPVVLLDRYLPSLYDKSYIVTPDNYAGGYALTRHLISLGHKRIGFCFGGGQSSTNDRFKGYEKCMQDHQLPLEPQYLKTIQCEEDYRIAAMQWKMMPQPLTAVFAQWDDIAYHLADALREFGVQVPGEMAVVGFDDYSIFKPKQPLALTTVHVPLWDEGQLAASMMVELIRAERPLAPTHVKVPCELVIRESCGMRRGLTPSMEAP